MATLSTSTDELDITDLDKVLTALKDSHFPDNQWDRLGLQLDITKPELDTIRKVKDSKDCLKECLSRWLQQDYDITQPKMESLAVALRGMGLRSVASRISKIFAQTYVGIVYYEEKGVEDVVTFTAAKKLNALLEYIKQYHPHAEIDQYVNFTFFDRSYGYIELFFNTPQDEPFTGWNIKPHITPCILYRRDLDNFGEPNYPLPPSCLVSVYGSPGAVPSLHYSIPLEGVVEPVTLHIHRSLRTTPPLPPPTNPNTSSSTSSPSSIIVSSFGGASRTQRNIYLSSEEAHDKYLDRPDKEVSSSSGLLYDNRSDKELSDSHSMLEILKKGHEKLSPEVKILMEKNSSLNEELAKLKEVHRNEQLTGAESVHDHDENQRLSCEIESLKKTNSVLKEERDMAKEQFRTALQELGMLKEKKPKDNKDELVDYGKRFSSNRERNYIILIYVLLVAFILYSGHTPKYFIAPLPGVEVIKSTDLTVVGGQSRKFDWKEYGLIIDVPSDALPCGFLANIKIRVSVSGPYITPGLENWKPVSAIYWISSSREFINPVTLGIWHNVRGKVNSSVIRVLTADDLITQNMSFVFQDHPANIILNGPYIYTSLNHFSGVGVYSTANSSFQGTLYYQKSPNVKYTWDYSFIVYSSYTDGIIEELHKTYRDWTNDLQSTEVEFENNSMELTSFTAEPKLHWVVKGKLSPLIYHKNKLQNEKNIKSNMQFRVRWKGPGTPEPVELTMHFRGTEQPKEISLLTNTNDNENLHKDKAKESLDLADIIQALKNNSYDVSTWRDLCLSLGLNKETLNTIKEDKSDSSDCLTTCLHKWLNRVDKVDSKGGATKSSLVRALEDIGQKRVAEGIDSITFTEKSRKR